MLQKERLIKKLIAASKCEVCGRNFETENIDILGHENEVWFLKILCSGCKHKSLIAAVVKVNKPDNTDLLPSEVEKFKHEPAVSTDDMLDMHNYLKDFDGDISHLLS